MKLAVEIIGWTGASLILLSYALLSSGKISSDSRLYQGMNIIGAAGFVVNSGVNGALPSAVVNVIWMGIGVYALMRNSRTRVADV